MLVPKRVKFRRVHRGHMRGEAKGGKTVTFGEFGLQATTSSWITNRQIEAARIAMTRYMKRGGKVWIKIFPHKSYTSKGVGVRMGNGKGSPEGWVEPVKRWLLANLKTRRVLHKFVRTLHELRQLSVRKNWQTPTNKTKGRS